MSSASLFSRLRGPFNFLEPQPEAIRTLFPDAEQLLPGPRQIFLENEKATPVYGFPIRRSAAVRKLAEALRLYVESEERAQLASLRRTAFDIPAHQASWESYRYQLATLAENVTTSNYGRDFPQIFWLYHSLDVVSALKGTSSRIRRVDLEAGRDKGDEIRYQVLTKYLDRVFYFLYDLSGRLARETNQGEPDLFPSLLDRMRDNVLIWSEDHIGRDLNELKSYFRGYLKIDGSDFLYRFALLRRWHKEILGQDSWLQAASEYLVRAPLQGPPEQHLLLHQGYVSFLSRHSQYDSQTMLQPEEVRLWEGLLSKLKEFELFHNVRRLIVELEPHQDQQVFGGRAASRLGAGSEPIVVNPDTRPIDFATKWIVDPEVSRGGLIYDLVDFSSAVSRLRRSDRADQDGSFRQIFLFQRRIGTLAEQLRARMEKYLGDGAFFSGRNLRRLLIAAVLIQRAYREALADGLPFDRGMRIALNFGSYRLLPLGTATGEVYEAFGHGLVELSRLVSGKRGLDIDDIKRTLLIKGYRDSEVHDFFAPLVSTDAETSAQGEAFYAHLDANGALINQGIVVTEAFLRELLGSEQTAPLFLVQKGKLQYIAFRLKEDRLEVPFGIRRLGLASLKGLDRVNVFEVMDGACWPLLNLEPMRNADLLSALDESFSAAVAGH